MAQLLEAWLIDGFAVRGILFCQCRVACGSWVYKYEISTLGSLTIGANYEPLGCNAGAAACGSNPWNGRSCQSFGQERGEEVAEEQARSDLQGYRFEKSTPAGGGFGREFG